MSEVLAKRLREALKECAAYTRRGGEYWWRAASMKKLAELGYVEPCGTRRKHEPYRVTKAGLKALAEADQ